MYIAAAEGARNALSLAGTMLGYYPVRVLPSKTAIAPVNPTFLPRVRFSYFATLVMESLQIMINGFAKSFIFRVCLCIVGR